MKLSAESRYAVAALSYLASQPNGTIAEAATVAAETGLPAPFLAKIFPKLTRHGLVSSHRGRQRGYALASPPDSITLRAVLEAIEGPDLFARCVFWGEVCSDAEPCPLHKTWATLRPSIAGAMDELTIADVAPPAGALPVAPPPTYP